MDNRIAVVRIIEPQQEESHPTDVTGSEAAYLLAKYGYNPQPTINSQPFDPNKDLTLDQMIENQNRELAEQRAKQQQQMYGPKPVTFDSRNTGYAETKYTDLDVDGHNFGIQVQIVSDMKIK